MRLYIHTINGQSAEYIPGEQICYAYSSGRGNRGITRFAKNLEQIEREQNLSIAWRLKQGFKSDRLDYGYARLEIP